MSNMLCFKSSFCLYLCVNWIYLDSLLNESSDLKASPQALGKLCWGFLFIYLFFTVFNISYTKWTVQEFKKKNNEIFIADTLEANLT